MEAVNAEKTQSETAGTTPPPEGDPGRRLFDVEDLPTRRPNKLLNWLRRLWPFGRQRARQPKVRVPDPFKTYLQTTFQDKSGSTFDLYDIEDVTARGQYGPLVVKGYLVLVALQTVGPLILWTLAAWGQPNVFSSGLRDLKDFVVAVSAGLSGVSGLAGFVIGRYFRARAESE